MSDWIVVHTVIRITLAYFHANNNNNNNNRRLASKCANSFGTNRLRPYFYPHQRGVGTPGGCEATVHSTRRYLENLPPDHVLVKLDFSNAFSSIHRREMLLSVHERIPELYAFCRSAYSYSQPSCLFFGPYIVSSEEGAQQGDPVGPLLFCNTIHPLLSSLKSNLNLGYLDDVTLGGTVKTVASDGRNYQGRRFVPQCV